MSAAAALPKYPVPWDVLARLTPHLKNHTAISFDWMTAQFVARFPLPPRIEGLENLPDDPRLILAANHHQRPGLWIAHPASAVTQAIRSRYGPGDPPVRWVVTANWPPWKIGPLRFRSPGDILLPRVAHALSCYAVPFAGTDPRATAGAYRRLLRDAESARRPIGIFPEGATGHAGAIGDALAGAVRLLDLLSARGWPVVPVSIQEDPGLVVRFGAPLAPGTHPGAEVMARVRELAGRTAR